LSPPPRIDTWTARLGHVVASDKHAFGRLEVDVAPELRPAPKHAQVVVALDASWSIGVAGLAAQLDIVRAYLSYVPDAEIELVAYRRHAQRVFGAFVAAKDFEAQLAAARSRGALALGNGSALDEGTRLAASLLALRHGPRRLVVATDELLRSSLTDRAALASLAALPADVVVHAVVPKLDGDDRPSLERDDANRLAPLATRHHGIFVSLVGLPAKSAKELAPVVLELVRPTRIEQLHVTGVTEDVDPILREGAGLRIDIAGKTAPTSIVMTGKIWSDPIRREVTPTAAFSQQTAAFVFGGDQYHELSDAEMMTVALAGRAVSPVTSYVAFEPGTRPSTVGLPLMGSGSGAGYGSGRGGMSGRTTSSPSLDLRSLVDVRSCIKKVAPPAGWWVTLTAETTKDEVVDVALTSGGGAMASCLIEAVWAVRLTKDFALDHEQFELAFR
jgi:hypothetical protein